ncbi:hypothetical protein D3C81_1067420 [compost metagenome]
MQEWSLRLVQCEFYRAWVNGFNLFNDAFAVRTKHGIIIVEGVAFEFEFAARIRPTVEVEYDRIGVKFGAVMEFHALTQLEGVFQTVIGHGPAVGQGTLNLCSSFFVLQ